MTRAVCDVRDHSSHSFTTLQFHSTSANVSTFHNHESILFWWSCFLSLLTLHYTNPQMFKSRRGKLSLKTVLWISALWPTEQQHPNLLKSEATAVNNTHHTHSETSTLTSTSLDRLDRCGSLINLLRFKAWVHQTWSHIIHYSNMNSELGSWGCLPACFNPDKIIFSWGLSRSVTAQTCNH